MSHLIDLTLDVETGMPTCGTPWHQTVEIRSLGKLAEVGRNTSSILLGSHSGTHMDAPKHFIDNGKGIETLSLDLLCGPVTMVDLRNKQAGDVVTLDDVRELNITERMLFIFGWYKHFKTDRYYKDFPYFSGEAVDWLMEKGMRLMAMDTPSPDTGSAIYDTDAQEADSPNHKKMLAKEIIIVEYLCNTDMIDLSRQYELIALPLKLKGSDG
ncbi:MAG: cyclase family protein, partial [Lachnospiraceae bacterium]|nr:cyclase family protein [Lachnospiraceae bacterium]